MRPSGEGERERENRSNAEGGDRWPFGLEEAAEGGVAGSGGAPSEEVWEKSVLGLRLRARRARESSEDSCSSVIASGGFELFFAAERVTGAK